MHTPPLLWRLAILTALAAAIGCSSSKTAETQDATPKETAAAKNMETRTHHKDTEERAKDAPEIPRQEPPPAEEPATQEATTSDTSSTTSTPSGKTHKGHSFQNPERYARRWNDPARDAYQKPDEILAALGDVQGRTVVDIGAGTGYLLPKLSEAVGPEGSVIALDVEPEMITYIEQMLDKEELTNVRARLGGGNAPNLDAACVDAAVTLNAWHHVLDRRVYATNLMASLKPGGRFVIVDFVDKKGANWGPPKKLRLGAEQVADELREVGYTAEVVSETMPRHWVVVATAPTE